MGSNHPNTSFADIPPLLSGLDSLLFFLF